MVTHCYLKLFIVGKLQVLDDQWRALPLQIENLPQEIKCTKNPEEFWHKVINCLYFR